MNRIQQEALAKSVGMNREDLAQTLFIQEQLAGATGEEAKKEKALLNSRIAAVGLEKAQKELAEGGLETLENQQSQAERLANTIDQLKEVFVSIAEPILAIGLALTPVIEMVGFLLKGIMGISTAIGGFLGNVEELGVAGAVLGGILAVLASVMAFTALSYIPVVGPDFRTCGWGSYLWVLILNLLQTPQKQVICLEMLVVKQLYPQLKVDYLSYHLMINLQLHHN